MKDRIETLIDALNKKRDGILDEYILLCELYSTSPNTWNKQGEDLAKFAGLLHDIDKHITNLHLERKRLEVMAHAA